MEILRTRNDIRADVLLSSTTYKAEYDDKCIYCHGDVKNDVYKYNEEVKAMTYRCDCEKASKELRAKEELLKELMELRKDVEVDRINNVTRHAIICEIEKAYDDEDLTLLDKIVKV